jgi:HSP20 family protein
MTTIARYYPATPDFRSLQSHFSRLFEPFVRPTADDEDLVSGSWLPPVDVAETQDKILVRAELPGVKQDQIQIEFENGVLTIRGDRALQKQDGVTWHRVERTYGSFSRSFTLPRTVDAEKISAAYRDGVLEIEVPKKEEAKPKQIRIAVQ